MMYKHILIVGAGGCIGSICRFLVYILLQPLQPIFPFATLLVNILGSLTLGFAAGYIQKAELANWVSLFFITGICGGFTTFSGFSADNYKLLMHSQYKLFVANILLNVFTCLLATIIGYKIALKF